MGGMGDEWMRLTLGSMRVENHNGSRDASSEAVAPDLLELTVRVVASFVSNHRVRVPELPALINSTYQALAALNPPADLTSEPGISAVPVGAPKQG